MVRSRDVEAERALIAAGAALVAAGQYPGIRQLAKACGMGPRRTLRLARPLREAGRLPSLPPRSGRPPTPRQRQALDAAAAIAATGAFPTHRAVAAALGISRSAAYRLVEALAAKRAWPHRLPAKVTPEARSLIASMCRKSPTSEIVAALVAIGVRVSRQAVNYHIRQLRAG